MNRANKVPHCIMWALLLWRETALLFHTNLSHARDFFITAHIVGYSGSRKSLMKLFMCLDSTPLSYWHALLFNNSLLFLATPVAAALFNYLLGLAEAWSNASRNYACKSTDADGIRLQLWSNLRLSGQRGNQGSSGFLSVCVRVFTGVLAAVCLLVYWNALLNIGYVPISQPLTDQVC